MRGNSFATPTSIDCSALGRLAVRSNRIRINYILSSLGLRKKGFFTPYNYDAQTPEDLGEYPEITKIFDSCRDKFENFISEMSRLESKMLATYVGDPRPNWTTRWISPLDGATIYTAVARFSPGRIIEIGSGNSTFFLCRSVLDHHLSTEITCIDPQPRATIDPLPVKLLRRELRIEDEASFKRLGPNDIIFIDSSHILQQNFDVDILFNRIFPILAKGVVVHVHDIFLPYPYPNQWSDYRFNEQNALIPWILSGCFEVVFASHYSWRRMAPELAAACKTIPLCSPDNGGSLWLIRR